METNHIEGARLPIGGGEVLLVEINTISGGVKADICKLGTCIRRSIDPASVKEFIYRLQDLVIYV